MTGCINAVVRIIQFHSGLTDGRPNDPPGDHQGAQPLPNCIRKLFSDVTFTLQLVTSQLTEPLPYNTSAHVHPAPTALLQPPRARQPLVVKPVVSTRPQSSSSNVPVNLAVARLVVTLAALHHLLLYRYKCRAHGCSTHAGPILRSSTQTLIASTDTTSVLIHPALAALLQPSRARQPLVIKPVVSARPQSSCSNVPVNLAVARLVVRLRTVPQPVLYCRVVLRN
jgi:hypothetical protein